MEAMPAISKEPPVATTLKEIAVGCERLADKAFAVTLALGGLALTLALTALVIGILQMYYFGQFRMVEQGGYTSLSIGPSLVGPAILLFGTTLGVVLSSFSRQHWKHTLRLRDQARGYSALRDLVLLDPSTEPDIRAKLISRLSAATSDRASA
ncbi:MAG: hypothetical protein KDB90_11940 [Planctomycetes bacterium]|nr:hypothetical protein [Planctomycetota bacterium]